LAGVEAAALPPAIPREPVIIVAIVNTSTLLSLVIR